MDGESEKNLEALKSQIDMEIEESKKTHGDRWAGSFFNNLVHNLPGGYRRNYDRDQMLGESTSVGFSEKRKNQTLGEFFDTIDDVLVEVSISAEEIKTEKKLLAGAQESRLYELLLPVYIKLREKGYNHKDLFT